MKKILSLTIFSLFLTLGLTSCKGDSPEPPTPPLEQGRKLLGYVDSDGTSIKTVNYDAQGRITSLAMTQIDANTNKNVNLNLVYRYTNDSIILSITNLESKAVNKVEYVLDAKHRVVKVILPETDKVEEGIYILSYNNRNQLAGCYANDGENLELTWTDGNISSVISRDEETKTTNYTYTDYNAKHFLSVDAVFGTPDLLGVDQVLFLQGYYGEYPKNLIKTETVVEDSSTLTYTYEIDAMGYVTKASDSKGKFCVFTWK